MEAAPRRPSNVGGMLLAGRYHYIDFPGAEPQLVDVTYEDGDAVVRFLDMGRGAGEVTLLVRDMAGEFERERG